MNTKRGPDPGAPASRVPPEAPREAGAGPPGRGAATTPDRPDDRLLTWPVLLLLSCGLLAWTAEGALQPTIPLLVLDRGGDAALVGIVAAAYALPTLLLRPLVGSRIDRGGHASIHRAGGALLATSPIGFLIPVLPLMPVVRLVQGVGWAFYGTSNNIVMAMLAPPRRRAEITAYYNTAYALGFLVGPPLGLLLYTGVAAGAPFLFASGMGCLAFLTATLLARAVRARRADGPGPSTQARSPDAEGPSTHGGAPPRGSALRAGPVRRFASLFEPTAIPPLLATALFMSTQSLFLPFAPVFARAVDEPIEALALYYPAYAILLAGGQLVAGRLVDRTGRLRAIGVGVSLAVLGLATATLPGGLVTFAIGGAGVALGTAVVTPAVGAATMDRAPEGRLGVTMATYSMGYQLAAGGGGALWGAMISGLGYPWPFLVAIGLQLLGLVLTRRWLGHPAGEPAPT